MPRVEWSDDACDDEDDDEEDEEDEEGDESEAFLFLSVSEIRICSGAAALSTGSSDADVRSAVALWASYNKVDGNNLLVMTDAASGDVQIGNWDSSATPKFSSARNPKMKMFSAPTCSRISILAPS